MDKDTGITEKEGMPGSREIMQTMISTEKRTEYPHNTTESGINVKQKKEEQTIK